MTTRLYLIHSVLLAATLTSLPGQTAVHLRTQSRAIDFSAAASTAPFKSGASLPATCQTGEAFFKTSAAAGQNLYACTSTNTWTVQGGNDTGPETPLDDFRPTVSGSTLSVAAGRARIGNYAPVTIAAGAATFTTGSGAVRVFIDANNNLVCHMRTGIAATTGGALVCSAVSQPAYPANSIPIADLAVDDGIPTILSDDRAFFSTSGVSAGTGISISDTGGVALVGIDTATVPQLGAASNDFTGAISALELRLLPSSEGSCDASNRGRIVLIFGEPGFADTVRICSKDAAGAYAWRSLL